MGQAQINVRTRACSRTSIARTKQAALTHNVRGKELTATALCRIICSKAVTAYYERRKRNKYGESVTVGRSGSPLYW